MITDDTGPSQAASIGARPSSRDGQQQAATAAQRARPADKCPSTPASLNFDRQATNPTLASLDPRMPPSTDAQVKGGCFTPSSSTPRSFGAMFPLVLPKESIKANFRGKADALAHLHTFAQQHGFRLKCRNSHRSFVYLSCDEGRVTGSVKCGFSVKAAQYKPLLNIHNDNAASERWKVAVVQRHHNHPVRAPPQQQSIAGGRARDADKDKDKDTSRGQKRKRPRQNDPAQDALVYSMASLDVAEGFSGASPTHEQEDRSSDVPLRTDAIARSLVTLAGTCYADIAAAMDTLHTQQVVSLRSIFPILKGVLDARLNREAKQGRSDRQH